MFSSSLCRILAALAALAVTLGAGTVTAQDGPPPEVDRAVSALLAVVNSGADAALDNFVATATDPQWVDEVGEAAILDRLREIRAASVGLDEDVGVQPAPDGVQVLLAGGGKRQRIAMDLSQAGVIGLRLLADTEAAPQQPGRAGAVQAHIVALEQSGRGDLESVLARFEATHFSAAYLQATTRKQRTEVLQVIRGVAAQAGGAMIREAGEETILSLRGPQSLDIVFSVEAQAPFRISALRTDASGADAPLIDLTWANAAERFAQLGRDGFSGVVHLARDGETVLHRAYGVGNRELGYQTRPDTIFGIGSTPIDFTVAAIYLLAESGKLDMDDTLGQFFADVPADKASMTIRHLIGGQSGLPDFHGIHGEDWDMDLAWIDRETAVRRILGQPMLFAPGEGRAHSHSAYGLAAAIVEIVSGQNYFGFLQENILQPAGMMRTGMYGDAGDFTLRDFAVGYAMSSVGVPNIPPNWGPTSWLVMGSGGMYSTLGDMLKFYAFVRSGDALEDRFAERWRGTGVGMGGSDRGFYIFHAYRGGDREAMMLINGEGRSPQMQALSRALEALVNGDD